jgi:hypothetical protein
VITSSSLSSALFGHSSGKKNIYIYNQQISYCSLSSQSAAAWYCLTLSSNSQYYILFCNEYMKACHNYQTNRSSILCLNLGLKTPYTYTGLSLEHSSSIYPGKYIKTALKCLDHNHVLSNGTLTTTECTNNNLLRCARESRRFEYSCYTPDSIVHLTKHSWINVLRWHSVTE